MITLAVVSSQYPGNLRYNVVILNLIYIFRYHARRDADDGRPLREVQPVTEFIAKYY